MPLGTDGFGRSDTREALRRLFETDAPHVVVATLAGAGRGRARSSPRPSPTPSRRYGIDPERGDPRLA